MGRREATAEGAVYTIPPTGEKTNEIIEVVCATRYVELIKKEKDEGGINTVVLVWVRVV